MTDIRMKCLARINYRPGPFGLERVECGQVVGVRTLVDVSGTIRAACAIPGHLEDVARHYGRYWSEQLDPMTQAKAAEDRAEVMRRVERAAVHADWLESEAREAWGK